MLVRYAYLLALAPALHGASVALLIGLSHYPAGMDPLPGVARDIEAMRRAAALMGFRDIRVLRDGDATREAIAGAIASIAASAGADDRVLIYFSGHGSRVKDFSGDEADGRDELLVTADTVIVGSRLRNYLLDDRFEEMLGGVQSRHVLVILDTCHSGTATKDLFSDGLVLKSAGYEGEPQPEPTVKAKGVVAPLTRYALLAACKDDEVAKAAEHGSLMTQALAALISQWRKQGKALSLPALHADVERIVGRRYSGQHPQLSGDDGILAENWFF